MTQTSTSKELVNVIKAINLLIAEEQWRMIDGMMYIGIHSLSPEMMSAVARSTFPVRGKLSLWLNFVAQCRDELNRRGLPADKILAGLLEKTKKSS